jgi:hypothetical protein
MRLLLIFAFAATVSALGVPGVSVTGAAVAAECTGDNCPPPAGQGRGRDCEHEKERATS